MYCNSVGYTINVHLVSYNMVLDDEKKPNTYV